MAVCQNLVPLVNIKKAGKWMFIPLKMVLIGIDPYPYELIQPTLQHVPKWNPILKPFPGKTPVTHPGVQKSHFTDTNFLAAEC